MLMSVELKWCITWFIYFLNLPWVRYNCAKFHHCRICVTDFREGGPFWSLPSASSPEKAHLNRVTWTCGNQYYSSFTQPKFKYPWNAHTVHPKQTLRAKNNNKHTQCSYNLKISISPPARLLGAHALRLG